MILWDISNFCRRKSLTWRRRVTVIKVMMSRMATAMIISSVMMRMKILMTKMTTLTTCEGGLVIMCNMCGKGLPATCMGRNCLQHVWEGIVLINVWEGIALTCVGRDCLNMCGKGLP